MIKLVAFDWNGTIIDDIEIGTAAESATRVYFGFPPTNVEEIRHYFEIPIRQYWVNAGLSGEHFDQHADEINKIYNSHYEPKEDTVSLRKGAADLLQYLKQSNIKSLIFSNHSIPHIDKQVRRLNIDEYFEKILARPSLTDLVHFNQNFKDAMLKTYVDACGLKDEEVIVIGDTTEEIEIAKNLNYIGVALTGGWQTEGRLQASKPDYLIHNLKELSAIIKKLNNMSSSTQ